MLKFFGADVASEGLTASVLPDPDLHGNLVRVPGDISSAAYFIAAALIVPGSEVLLKMSASTRPATVCSASAAPWVLTSHF